MKEADGPSLQKLLDTAKGKPEEAAVSMMVLRSLMKARYDGENLGHFGLAANTTATSPPPSAAIPI